MAEISWANFAGNAREDLDRQAADEKERQRQEARDRLLESREKQLNERRAAAGVPAGFVDNTELDDRLRDAGVSIPGMTDENFNFIIVLNRGVTAEIADESYANGLTDPDWVKKGGHQFLEFNRRAATFEEAARKAWYDCEYHELKPRCVQQFTPTGHLDEPLRPQGVLVASGPSTSNQTFWVPATSPF